MNARSTTVVIAAYNAEATLERAVVSAQAQPETGEICIVDDASSDGTRALAERLAAQESRVRVIALPRNSGPAAARNAAIAATSAPWITILDADDYMLADRLARLHAHAEHTDFIADALVRVTEGAIPSAELPALTPRPLDFRSFVLGNLGQLSGPLDLGFLKPLFRRSFVEAHRLRYREDMRLGEDYEFYARALALGAKFLTCEAAGYISVERAGSLSKDHREDDLQRLRDCDAELSTIRAFAPQERSALRRHWNSVDCRLQWRRLITAVKRRNVGAAISTFHSPQTAAFLAVRLGEQAWLRGTAFARGPS